MPIDLPFRVAVIGVRDTGARIAAWLALRGFPVAVYDTSLDAATATRQVTDVLVASATYTEAIAVEARRRVLVVTDSLAAALHGASWVIDCAQEPLAVKLGTLAAIGGAMPVGCLLTTPAYWCSLTELREHLPPAIGNTLLGCRFLDPIMDIPVVEITTASAPAGAAAHAAAAAHLQELLVHAGIAWVQRGDLDAHVELTLEQIGRLVLGDTTALPRHAVGPGCGPTAVTVAGAAAAAEAAATSSRLEAAAAAVTAAALPPPLPSSSSFAAAAASAPVSPAAAAANDVVAMRTAVEPASLAFETPGRVEVMTTITATRAGAAAAAAAEPSRTPLALVVALDTSGSMSGAKLELCLATCTAVVDLLGAGDVFGLVTFASAAREALPLTAMDAPGKRAAHAAIAACAAGGNTALEAGVTMAVGMFAGRVGGAGSATQYVLLLTDGQANVGCTERSGIAASLRASLGALGGGGSGGAGPLTLSTFGFGTDADAALMQDLASAADGMYYFIADMGAIPIAFSEALGEAMSVALRNVVVEIRITPPGGGARLAEVYMEQGVTIDGGVARVSLGSMTAASRRDVLFAVTLPALPGPAPAPTPFVTVTVSYELPAAGAQPPGALLLLRTYGAASRPAAAAVVAAPPEREHAVQRLRVTAARALRAAKASADRGDLGSARAALAEATAAAARCAYPDDPLVAQVRVDLAAAADGLRSREVFETRGAHELGTLQMSHALQRADTRGMRSGAGASVYSTMEQRATRSIMSARVDAAMGSGGGGGGGGDVTAGHPMHSGTDMFGGGHAFAFAPPERRRGGGQWLSSPPQADFAVLSAAAAAAAAVDPAPVLGALAGPDAAAAAAAATTTGAATTAAAVASAAATTPPPPPAATPDA